MSKFCGHEDSSGTLRAAAHWRLRALESDGSVFTDHTLWTAVNIDSLNEHFVENPDLGEGGFLEKLEKQLANLPPATPQLAAEMLWAMRLCPTNIGPAKKREQAMQIWSWSGSRLSPDIEWLQDEVLGGVGSAGMGYNTNVWRELVFMIRFMRRFKALSASERSELLSDGYKLAEWMEQIEECDVRQVRPMLLFMLFPDDFERIFGGTHRRLIVSNFSGIPIAEAQRLSPLELDKKLAAIRKSQEAEHPGVDLDFYVEPFHSAWASASPQGMKPVRKEHVLAAISDIDRDGVPDKLQSTGYDLVHESHRYPPKYVISLAFKHSTGKALAVDLFKGGEKSEAFRHLRKLGFTIEAKRQIAEMVQHFIEQADGGIELGVSGYPKSYRGLASNVSFGKGNIARVPWISFTGYEQTTQHGIYPVLLYYKSSDVLILAYGISETEPPDLEWDAHSDAPTVRDFLRETYETAPERYGASLVRNSYRVPDELDYDKIAADVDELIGEYENLMKGRDKPPPPEDFTIEDALEDLFLSREQFEDMLELLRLKKNVVLQGPPGVGKTFVCKRLAYALIGQLDSERVAMVQFHQTYSYEDFIQGYRPSKDGFTLRDGIFYQFCAKAAEDLSRDYVFIIDEINRGNLSKIFGELMMLLEADKRGPEWAVPLTYGDGPEDTYFVPENLYLIGLMNTADRSLAMVDYALRRRFGFVGLEPGFDTEQFNEFLIEQGAEADFVEYVVSRVRSVNQKIADDIANLGPGYRIGHSFFCTLQEGEKPDSRWYRRVIRNEIAPLLREYWFDDMAKAEELIGQLALK